jgi:DNA replication and repair protein RecF
MGFEAVRFFNFRNLLDRELAVGAREVFLVGENGQGKTNFLEAIHLLSFASSFRESRDPALARNASEAVGLAGGFRDPAGERAELSLHVTPGKKKEIRVDGKVLADRRELLGRVPCVCMVQQDMEFVSGPPEARRRFFDQTLGLSDPPYLDVLRAYRRVLRARNLVLKSRREELLDLYDGQLAPLGIEISGRRAELVERFNEVFSPLFAEITGAEEPMGIRYRPSWRGVTDPGKVLGVLASCRGRDSAFGTSTSGPHRDLFLFEMGGKDYTRLASTGQLRLCALVLRAAEARFLAARTGRKPVLLLDDVLLELDPARKRSFIERFPPYEQAFFTFLPDENYLPYRGPDTLTLAVKEGGFTPA